jgi:cytoskeletal protein RodZ
MTDHHGFAAHSLRERREELGFSKEDVYRKLHIPVNFLEALEQGDFVRLPASTYALGFLRTYCSFLALDVEEYVASYRASIQPPSGLLGIKARARSTTSSPRFSDLISWAAICAVVAVAWIAYNIVVQPETEVTDGRVEAGTVELVMPVAPNE